MSRASTRLIVLALLGVLATPAGCSPDREALHTRAQQSLARGDEASIRESLESLRGDRFESAESLLLVTALMLRVGEAPQAIWYLEEGLVRFPERDDVRVRLAGVALIVGNPALASGAANSVEPSSPQHLEALLLRARASLELGDLEAALGLLDEAERRYPEAPQAAAARIATFLQERRYTEAAAEIEAARETGALDAAVLSLDTLAAQIEVLSGDVAAARTRLRHRTDAAPADFPALELLIPMLIAENGADEALERTLRARDAAPTHGEGWALLAQVRLLRGERGEAETAMRGLVEHSESPSASLLLAEFYRDGDEPERAAAVFADASAEHPDSPMLVMHHAESLIELDRLEAARERAAAFRKLAPDDPHVGYLDARLALAEGEDERSARLLKAVVSRLDRGYTQYWLARALESAGDFEAAERRFGLALVREPRDSAPVIALLRLADRRGDWGLVADRALQLIERAPHREEGYSTAATALVRAQRTEPAERVARLARERFPDSDASFASLAFVLRARGDLDASLDVLDEAEGSGIASPALDIERALVEAARGRTAEGLDVLIASQRRHPESAALFAAEAALRFSARDATRGAAAVDRALDLDPEDLEPLALRARFRTAVGDFAGALADCDRYLAGRPGSASIHYLRAAVLSNAGRDTEAIAAYQEATQLEPRHFAAHNNLAVLLEKSGRSDDALRHAQQAYTLAEDDPSVVDTLGWLYLRRGLADRARALLEKAHSAAPENDSTSLHLAQAYAAGDRPDAAREILDTLLADAALDETLRAEATAARGDLAD